MNHLLVNTPPARSWRDIPQPVKPRAMSRGGRWRLGLSLLRVLALVAAILSVAWGVWQVVAALQENPRNMSTGAQTVPAKNFVLKTNLDGVLDAQWLQKVLAVRKGATLMELDLQQLRARLLADGQVISASLTRIFPDTLEVRIAERAPVVRLHAQFASGEESTLLVARDGVVFAGAGFDQARIDQLPWLAGTRLTRRGGRFAPIDGMNLVADLFAQVQLEAGYLFATWQAVSLARLSSDREIEVRTKPGTAIVFGADGDFALQIAKLDYEMEMLAKASVPASRINLSLGRDVPVTFDAPADTAVSARNSDAAMLPAKPSPAPLFSLLPNSQPKTKREF